MTSAQNGDLTHFFEDLNQIEKLSEIKPPLVEHRLLLVCLFD